MLRKLLITLTFTAAGTTCLAGPLHDAVRASDVEGVEALMYAGADLNELDDNGETPLNMAILAEDESLAIMLLEAGASAEARNEGGFTALHAAAYSGAPKVAEALLGRGVDINDRQNKAGVTALSLAAEQGNAEVAKVLLDGGANVDLSEQNGYTPLSRALWRNRDEVVGLLQAAGAQCQSLEILGDEAHARCMSGQK